MIRIKVLNYLQIRKEQQNHYPLSASIGSKIHDVPIGYFYSATGCVLTLSKKRKDIFSWWGRYGKASMSGDCISIYLNLDTKELGFKINGEDQGVAFEDIKNGADIKYRLVVWVQSRRDCVEIVDFREL